MHLLNSDFYRWRPAWRPVVRIPDPSRSRTAADGVPSGIFYGKWRLYLVKKKKETLLKYLWEQIIALRGVRNHGYHSDMPRLPRNLRLALYPTAI